MFKVSPYKRVNMTWLPYIYEQATLILPSATFEVRQSLDEVGLGINTHACASSNLKLNSNVRTIWGALDGHRAHLLIGEGEYM